MKNLKPIFLAIIIIIFVIILDIITVNNTKNMVSYMNEILDEIDEKTSQDESADEEVFRLAEEWNKREKILSYYLEHEEIEKISGSINLIQKQIEIEEFDDVRQSVAEIKFLFEHIKEKQILNIENFF